MASATLGPTAALCHGLTDLFEQPLDVEVARAAKRSLLNVVGTTVGAAHSDAVEALLAYANSTGAYGNIPVLGRVETVAPSLAALMAGVAAHYDDFDDTHLETVIHPSAACLGALLAVGLPLEADGRTALSAFSLGIEAQLRVGAAMSPSHYDLGWHITGTCGVLGAAITAGLLLGFDARQLEAAIGVAANLTVGVREGFGTMTKPYHPGRASANGVLAARFVAAGGDGPRGVLEAPGGYVEALADEVDWARVTTALGERWELFDNTFKPYPCGIVCHPGIYAATQLSRRVPRADVVHAIVVRCHALVPELTGNPDPQDGLQARFSTIHGVCAGLADGTVGLPQYGDERVRAEDLIRLRACTTLHVDPGMARDAAVVEVVLEDGSVEQEVVEHAPGSLARPLTDEELRDKVRALIEPVLPGQTDRVIATVQDIDRSPDLHGLCAAATPTTAETMADAP